MRDIFAILLFCVLLCGCGPRAVRSPNWILGEPVRYPSALYLIGVGSAPTSGGLADALKAAGSSARAELAKTIEVRIDHIQKLVDQSTEVAKKRGGQTRLALEAERSDLTTFTQTSTEQMVQGIELKEKYHDEKRGILYVLAVLDKERAGERLEKEILGLDGQTGLLVDRARLGEREGDLLSAVRLYREALNRCLKAEVLQKQLRVIDPYRAREVEPRQASGVLAVALMDLFLRYGLHVSVEEYTLIEDTIHESLVRAGFDARIRRIEGKAGLTLWGTVNTKRGTFPALANGGDEELQVCRVYLGIKLVDDRTGAIVGQVNLLDNSNAENAKLAEERALRLLREQILEELPEALYRALSFEVE